VTIGGRGVVRHGVAVDREADVTQQILGGLAVQRRIAKIGEHEVDVRAAGDDADTRPFDVGAQQSVGDDAGARKRAALPVGEFRRRRDPEGHRLGRDHLHRRTALRARKHRRVDGLREFPPAQDQSGTPVTESTP
jgi:hypothetical protein